MTRSRVLLVIAIVTVFVLVGAGALALGLWWSSRSVSAPPVVAPSTSPEPVQPAPEVESTESVPSRTASSPAPMATLPAPEGADVPIEVSVDGLDEQQIEAQADAAVAYLVTRYTIDQSKPYPGLDIDALQSLTTGKLAKRTKYEIRDWRDADAGTKADYAANSAWRQEVKITRIIATDTPEAAITVEYELRSGSHGNMTPQAPSRAGFGFDLVDGEWVAASTTVPQGI